MSPSPFLSEVSRHIWETKYRYRNGEAHDRSIADTWQRVARALAAVEQEPARWEPRFRALLDDFRFLPGGRILAGAGTAHEVTLFNCFVMGIIEDSLDGIFDALKEGALTMQQGGGVGYDFSTLRPRGSRAHRVGTIASGPVSFMRIWDAMCATLLSTGARRGAMMATLRCDHPDIEEFIAAKQQPGELRHFNLSVQITDDFMQAVENDKSWPLVFPRDALADDDPGEGTVERVWSGRRDPVPCRVLRTVRARDLWDRIMRATYDYAEPGVLFIDRINHLNNLAWRERITATNPCGEVPLPPYGACDLGSVNLTRFVREPFSARAALDEEAIAATVREAVRFMDNVIDVSRYPLPQQAETERGCRRIGLGLTGLADALILLNLRYDSEAGVAQAARIMALICHTAYRASIELAKEKGAFPVFEREPYLDSAFVATLPADIRDGIAAHGIRNSHLTAIAPTGTISLLANNVSSGLEPVFDFAYRRRILETDGHYREYALEDYAWRLWQQIHPDEPRPDSFVEVNDLQPADHLRMQAAIQPYVDNAISKTINVPADCPFEDFRHIYHEAWRQGLKGCTTFRPNPVTGAILQAPAEESRHCCNLEREAD